VHLLGRLRVVEASVRASVEARRAVDPGLDDPFRGLYIGDDDIDRSLTRDTPRPSPAPAADEARRRLAADAAAQDAAGTPTRLAALARSCGLDPIDEEILLVAVAPDVDRRFERFYGYLHDDVTRRRASVGLALELAGLHPAEVRARERLGPRGALVDADLVEVDDAERPFLTRALRVPDRVTAHLLGGDTPDPAVADLIVEPVAIGGDSHGDDAGSGSGDGDGDGVLSRLAGVMAGDQPEAPTPTTTPPPPPPLVYVTEPPGASGRSFAATALARSARRALVADLDRLGPQPDLPVLTATARALAREARLQGAALVAGPVDDLAEHDPRAVRALAELPVAVILTGRRHWQPGWSRRVPMLVTAPVPPPAERARVWRERLDGQVTAGLDPADATSQFRLTPEQVADAAATAINQARLTGAPVDADGLRRGARSRNGAGLERRARRIEPAVGWDDLVLPPASLHGLRDLALRVRHRDQVLTEWAMRPGGGRGRGVTALFAGDSGTGKTMSAEVIAGHLGLDLYVIDLATVVDKYVGETEKNLERVFGEADGVNGVLLFDEADAIFGKRSEVRDAHDRYANIEVAYLLQRMETFDGLAILTTNLRANLDDAFTRRLDAIIDFPMPDEDQRRVLWQRCLGDALPTDDDIDLDFCARQFELAGGHIRSIAITAAYLAAGRGTPVRMADLVQAIQREYRKLGRLLVRAEFGPWLDVELATDSGTAPAPQPGVVGPAPA
jgi:hypothetical protein